MRLATRALSGLLAAALARPSAAAVQVGAFDTPGSANDVALVGATAFVADGLAGLRILDVSDPSAPAELAAVAPLPLGNVTAVAVDGGRAYLAEGVGGIALVDVSDPASPVPLGSATGFSIVTDVAAAGDWAYVSSNVYPGFYVVDVSDPAQPVTVASLSAPSQTLVLRGDVVYAGGQVIDVSDPQAPLLVAATGGFASAFGDGFAVSTRPVRYDVSDPLAPQVVNSWFGPLLSQSDVALTGELAWTVGSVGFSLYEVSDASPRHPQVGAATLGSSLTAGRIQLAGNRAYVAAGGLADGLHVLDASNPAAPVVLGVQRGEFTDADVAGSLACAVVQNQFATPGLHVIDVSNPTAPVEIGLAPLAGAGRVRMSGSRAYVVNVASSPDVLWVYDLSNPAAPSALGAFVGDLTMNALQVVGTRIYLATSTSGTAGALVILDASNPAAIVESGRFTTSGQATGIAVAGTRAFLTSDAVEVLDVTFPFAPLRITSFDLPDTRFSDPEPSGTRLHVGATRGQILTLDFADLLLPRLLGTADVAQNATTSLPSGDAAVSGATLWNANAAVRVFDTAQGSGIGPRKLASFAALTGIRLQIDAARDLAVLADGAAGLRLVDFAADRAVHECANGRDDDGDGLVDHLADPGCASGADASERPDCGDGLDNDGDTRTDHPADPDCASMAEADEGPACRDGIDNDGDGAVDFGADLGCASFFGEREDPACQNGDDDDGDGVIDFDGGASLNGGVPIAAVDLQCPSATRDSEVPSSCGLGAELAPLLAFLALRRRARIRPRS